MKIGRLKLRENDNENVLINYIRENTADSKKSEVILYRHKLNKAIKDMLALQLGIKIIVDKIRKIYCIDNVKFHFHQVKNLGTFMEVEAIDKDNSFTTEKLKEQCDFYYDYFKIKSEQLEKSSYSDLLLSK
ncbi:adenylyl cyclase CyaB, putative [Flavobacterium xinjiangense]|uniref:Adenylyl cyclase CyaB, putative n=1 Tax=Flavobacterium xinjiangense TaxID=178356 RepID=A0A1M7P843_9FLAO|nr:adenylyl cyclase CyaB, putative [Flavobacterium xinjiangense]